MIKVDNDEKERLYVWLAFAPALEIKRFCETAGYCVEFFGDHEYRMYKER